MNQTAKWRGGWHASRADLVTSRDDAIEALRVKSEFVAVVSHEIRTPMAGVIGVAGLLADTQLDDTQRSYVDAILESGHAMLLVLNDTLDFSKLEAGKFELEREDFDLTHLVESVVTLVSVLADGKGVAVRTEIAADAPAHVRGDAGRLRQVLLNLLGNAVKFTNVGTVTVRVSSVVQRPDDDWVKVNIEIEDTGIGIAGDPARLFEPFSQASPNTARKYGGTGLGLAICARLVGAMGGTIVVQSTSGTGSNFLIQLPLELASEAAKEGGAAKRSLPAATDRGLVLIVDDDRINRLVAGQLLTRLGFSFDTADNGREALKMLAGQPYAAVLMDCLMPVMDGFDATATLRTKEGKRRHTTVIATSAGPLDGERGHCEAVGMDDYVAKPLTLDHLEAALARTGM
jgi:CheY-like chemotaxis protein